MRACIECEEEMDTGYCPDCGAESEPLDQCGECGGWYFEAGECPVCEE